MSSRRPGGPGRRWIRVAVAAAAVVLFLAVAIAACTWANSLQ